MRKELLGQGIEELQKALEIVNNIKALDYGRAMHLTRQIAVEKIHLQEELGKIRRQELIEKRAKKKRERLEAEKIGFVIGSYHDGSSLESRELNTLFQELPKLKKSENASGWYILLVAPYFTTEEGNDMYINHLAYKKYQAKTVEELEEIMKKVNAMSVTTLMEGNEE